jgi:hypothetical protein
MIIIPMAGLSSRFFKDGFKVPKYMLEANGLSLFEHAINSFKKYFEKEMFLFVIRDVYDTREFIEKKIKILGITNYKVVVLEHDTKGQAETVALGIESFADCENGLTIFNIDTFRPNFVFPDLTLMEDGYLEVFEGEGDNWSFAKPYHDNSTLVKETAEKKAISRLCCTGLYYFKSTKNYLDAYYDYKNKPIDEWAKGEVYVAPLFNFLINKKLNIHYNLISRKDVIFCGTPKEYQDILNDFQ